MGRPDGRIEKGQSLNRAISARAWNRAQDAADVVLGVRPGFSAPGVSLTPYAIVVAVKLTSPPTVNYPYVGVPIKITGCDIFGTAQNPAGVSEISGEIAEPTDLRNTTFLPAPEMFAVTVEPMVAGASPTTAVRCAIKGLCVARVRIYSATDRYVALPSRRSTAETVESLRGTLESSAAGYGRLIATISNDFSLVSI